MSVQRVVRGKRIQWKARWREEGRHRSRTFDRRADAVAFEAEMVKLMHERRQLGAFATRPASDLPLATYISQAWDARELEWEQTTKDTWADIIDAWILPALGDVPLNELTRARVRAARSQMVNDGVTRAGRLQKASNNRANAVMTVLSAFCGFAVDDGMIPENPCREISRLAHRASKHRAHEPLVFERLRAEMTARDALAVSLMYLAGLRPQEVFALQWRHVGVKTLIIEQATTGGKIKGTKTGVAASIDLVSPLAEDLAAYRASLPAPPRPDDLVIAGRQGEGILRLRPWRANVWHGARARAGLDPMTPYDGRHTFGSLLIHEGRDVLYVQRQMRHASSTMTLGIYAHELAEWQGREKVTLVEGVRAARAQLAAEGGDTEAEPQAWNVAPAPSETDPAPGSCAFSVPQTDTDEGSESAENPGNMRDGRYWARTSDPQLVELAGGVGEVTAGSRSADAEGDPADDDESDEPGGRSRTSRRVPQMCPGTGEYPGACGECARPLSLGLEGSYCEACEIECPSCGEAECRATCIGELARTVERRRRHERRQVVDLRHGREARRVNQRSVWSLAGAR